MRAARLTVLLLAAALGGARGLRNKTIIFKLRANVAAATANAITESAHLAPARRIFRPAGKFEKQHRAHGLWEKAAKHGRPD